MAASAAIFIFFSFNILDKNQGFKRHTRGHFGTRKDTKIGKMWTLFSAHPRGKSRWLKMVFQRVKADRIIQIIRCKVGVCHRLMKYQVATLKRWNAPVYGFRVCEAHHDGTPHWHLLLFMRPEDRNRVIGILQRYALTDDHEELVRDIKGCPPFTDFTPRFDWKEIDPAKGDAAGYIAKYIAKNIDGAYLDDDEEAGTAADEGALHAVAWASWWGIRTFQQIGGAPVGVWRELRRISNAKKHAELVGPPKPVLQDPRFEAARFAADNGIFRCYLHAMGGALATRAEHPIKLAHLIDEQANSYGEDIKRLMGITSARLGIKTRLQGWEIVPAGTHEARKTAEAAARGVGFRRATARHLGALTITVRCQILMPSQTRS